MTSPESGVRNASIGTSAEQLSQVSEAPPQAVIDLDLSEVFDYASFMWDDSGLGCPLPQAAHQSDPTQMSVQGIEEDLTNLAELMAWPSPSTLPLSESELLDLFSRSNAPPILVTAESSLRWSTIRKLFTSMASTSSMVRHAVLAFSCLRQTEVGKHDTHSRSYYDKSKIALLDILEKRKQDADISGTSYSTYALAVLFILVYIDVCKQNREIL